MLNGVLVVNKPQGLRSTDCLRQLSRLLGRRQRIGHAGTLDSTASGALIVLLGSATRLSDYVMNLPKTYRAVIQFGWETDTEDGAGQPRNPQKTVIVDDQKLRVALMGQLGTRLQKPPAVSAVWVDGARSHRLAREGRFPEPKARPVTITALKVTGAPSPSQRQIEVNCHRGTYVRSLARDVGQTTGWLGHLSSLHRLHVGRFQAEDGLSPDNFNETSIANCLRPVQEVAFHYPHLFIDDRVERRLLNGLPQRFDFLSGIKFGDVSGPVALIGSSWLSLCRFERLDGHPMLRAMANVLLNGAAS